MLLDEIQLSMFYKKIQPFWSIVYVGKSVCEVLIARRTRITSKIGM